MFSLSKTRRKRPVPKEWAVADSISAYTPKTTSQAFFPGGSVLAVHEDGERVLTAGSDGSCGVVSLSENTLLLALKPGKGSATSGIWAQDRTVIATSTGSVKVFEQDRETHSFSNHNGRANAVALHPNGTILASVGEDQSYALYDLESDSVLARVYTNSGMFGHAREILHVLTIT